MFEKAQLQDIRAGIRLWEGESAFHKLSRFLWGWGLNRQKVLEELKFNEKQMLERIEFKKQLKQKYEEIRAIKSLI